MQPDREDAERDDAGVEVAAHFFSLSRGLRSSARRRHRCVFCEPFARLAPPRALLSPLWSRLGVQWHLTPRAHRAAFYAPQWYEKRSPLRGTLLFYALRPHKSLSNCLQNFASVSHAASPQHVKTLAAFPGQPPPWQTNSVHSAALSLSARLDLCFLEPPRA